MCGIFGVYNHSESAKLTYLGLYALQHRGQESAGIISSDGKRFFSKIATGLVADVFTKDELNKLKGSCAIGHVRYSTFGLSNLTNAQPFAINYSNGNLAIAHNGNLCNAKSLKEKLERDGSIFQTSSDSEVFLHLIARSKKIGLEQKIIDAISQIKGAYSLLFLLNKKLIAVRDPLGFRPLCIGKLKNSYIVSSESCAFDLIGAKYIRDVKPGEIVSISDGKIESVQFCKTRRNAFCIFEFIYFSRPDSKVFGKSVYNVRKNLGRQLSKESKTDADIVISVPDSANAAAVGFSEQSKIQYEIGFIRNHYVGRTFIEPRQEIRNFGVKIKYNPVSETLYQKNIVLVDDSIVRGTTSKKLIKLLRKTGVKKIHHRISSPPIKYPCFYGIDTPKKSELIAAKKSVDEIKKFFDDDTLYYLSIDGLIKATGLKKDDFCLACFTGDYPIK
ncbi:MAG: amidophosphoribosyltransferase [Elusimicrobiota bacterium]